MSQTILFLLLKATGETLFMVATSTVIALFLGLPLGVLLYISRPGNILQNVSVNRCLSILVNVTRSIPFIILMIAVIPFTRLIVGTSIGTNAAIVPLSLAAMPFVARVVESALLEIDKGLIEAALAMGATPWHIIHKVLLPEAFPSIINGLTLTTVSLVGYSAMAGAVGGGGLGDLAIRYGYQRFDTTVMFVTIIVMIFIVQAIQYSGDALVKRFSAYRL
jgi:D-methionine transport system permease protein